MAVSEVSQAPSFRQPLGFADIVLRWQRVPLSEGILFSITKQCPLFVVSHSSALNLLSTRPS
jgi:hypothetical protein